MKLILCGLAATLMFVQPSMADDTPLAKQMDEMNDAYKAMRRETDPTKGAELARTAQDAIVKAIVELPEMVKAMATNVPSLVAVSKAMEGLTPKVMASDIGVPLHPGAAKYYKEVGAL